MNETQQLTGSGAQPYRFRADVPAGTVVFMLGMRVNEMRRVSQWLPVFRAMPEMLRELYQHPELGMLGGDTWMGWRQILMVQYWQSMDQLMHYATARGHEHLPAWAAFNRRARGSHAVGIWHEAYEVQLETSRIIYRDMPLLGMGKATSAMRAEHLPPQPVRRRGSAPDESDAATTGEPTIPRLR